MSPPPPSLLLCTMLPPSSAWRLQSKTRYYQLKFKVSDRKGSFMDSVRLQMNPQCLHVPVWLDAMKAFMLALAMETAAWYSDGWGELGHRFPWVGHSHHCRAVTYMYHTWQRAKHITRSSQCFEHFPEESFLSFQCGLWALWCCRPITSIKNWQEQCCPHWREDGKFCLKKCPCGCITKSLAVGPVPRNA